MALQLLISSKMVHQFLVAKRPIEAERFLTHFAGQNEIKESDMNKWWKKNFPGVYFCFNCFAVGEIKTTRKK